MWHKQTYLPHEHEIHTGCWKCGVGTFHLCLTNDYMWICDKCHYIGHLKVIRDTPIKITAKEIEMSDITSKDVGNVLTNLHKRTTEELLLLSEKELMDEWRWEWDSNRPLENNTYTFFNHLEIRQRRCKQWETHHNGGSCVVERVRDKYLMPKIKEFVSAMLAKHVDS